MRTFTTQWRTPWLDSRRDHVVCGVDTAPMPAVGRRTQQQATLLDSLQDRAAPKGVDNFVSLHIYYRQADLLLRQVTLGRGGGGGECGGRRRPTRHSVARRLASCLPLRGFAPRERRPTSTVASTMTRSSMSCCCGL